MLVLFVQPLHPVVLHCTINQSSSALLIADDAQYYLLLIYFNLFNILGFVRTLSCSQSVTVCSCVGLGLGNMVRVSNRV